MPNAIRRLLLSIALALFALLPYAALSPAHADGGSAGMSPQRMSTSLPMFVETRGDLPLDEYNATGLEGGWVAVHPSREQSFYLTYCNEDTVRAYSSEIRRLRIQSVTLPPDSSPRTVVRLLDDCPGLTSLRLQRCEFTEGDIEALSKVFSHLRSLVLCECQSFTDVSALGLGENLQELALDRCSKLTDVNAIGTSRNLRRLTFSSCNGIRDISAVSNLKGLKSFAVLECESIKDLSPIFGLTSLDELEIGLGDRIMTLPSVPHLPVLRGGERCQVGKGVRVGKGVGKGVRNRFLVSQRQNAQKRFLTPLPTPLPTPIVLPPFAALEAVAAHPPRSGGRDGP